MKGFVLGLAAEGRRLWRRLSVAQRISVIGISAAAALGLTFMALEARAPVFRHLITLDLAGGEGELRELCRRLDAKRINWRRATSAEGESSVEVEVEDGQRESALEVLSSVIPESGELTEAEAREQGRWVFDDIGILSGPSLLSERAEVSKRLRIEETISWLPDVQRARLEYHPPERDFLRTPRTDGSATVTLFLRASVEKLSPRKARVVRKIVCGAYNLRPECVTLTDNVGNTYRVSDAPEQEEDFERFLEDLESEIRGVLSSPFTDVEFQLVVRPSRLAVNEGADLRAGLGGLMGSSSRRTVDLSVPEEPEDGETAPFRTAPRRGVDVVAFFDRAAVHRLLQRDGPFRTERDFTEGQRQVIETLVSPHPSRVRVLVLPLTPVVVAAASRTAAPRESGSSWKKWGVWRGWLERDWPLLVTVGAVLIVVLIGGVSLARSRISTKRSPRGSEGAWPGTPRGAASSSGDGTMGNAPWRFFPSRASAAARSVDPLTGAHVQGSLLSATDRMSEWVQDRPQTAASVLRVWLEQPAAASVAEVSSDGGRR